MKSLETRVAYLEGLLQESRPEVAVDHFPRFGDQEVSADDLARRREALTPANNNHAPDTEDRSQDLPSEVALLCINAAGREPQFFGASSAVSFSRIVSATMGMGSNGRSAGGPSQQNARGSRPPTGGTPFDADRIAQPTPLRLPTIEMRSSLVEAYFKNIHPQYPLLHRPTFSKWESDCWRAASEGTLDLLPDMAVFSALMVYAIGSLVLGQSYTDAAEAYYAAALDRIASILDLDSLESIQAILFCAVYSIRSPVGVSLWKISGMAIRHCIELGYHLDADKYRRHADPLTKEISKRCFWVAYDIDRVAAFTLGRPLGIPEDSIDVELPLDIDDENITATTGLTCPPRSQATDPPTLMTGAIHAIKLRRLWTQLSDHLYPTRRGQCTNDCVNRNTFESLRTRLEEWRASAPDYPDHSTSRPLSVFASKSWFRLAYDHSILLLYRHYMVPPPSNNDQSIMSPTQVPRGSRASHNNDGENVDAVLEECFLSAKDICLTYRRIYQSSSVQFTWGSLHHLFLGGLTYLFCLWRSARIRAKTKQSDIITTCLACSTVLIIIAERWNLATSYRDIFEALSQKTIAMVCDGGPNNNNNNNNNSNNLTTTNTADTCGNNINNSKSTPTGTVFADAQTHLERQTPSDPSAAYLEDWSMGLDDLTIPQESEWLIQELLRGVAAGGMAP